MIASMDLNASPLPEDDDQPYEEQVYEEVIEEERIESSVETLRREREERKRRLRREHQDEPRRPSQQIRNEYIPQHNRGYRPYGRSKELPPVDLPANELAFYRTLNMRSPTPEMRFSGFSLQNKDLRWLNCPPAGQCIGHYIIPSKVPLDESYNDLVPPGKRYSSKQAIDKQKKQGRDIGMVIDLTNTSRYYSPSEWTKQGIKHLKIQCKGRDAVPDNESVNSFVFEVIQFVNRQKHSKKFILVHCTHGHNRTGFMIINYLMRSQLLHVADAINQFAEVRPPGIYKHDYLEALYSFYHETPGNLICPRTPEWKRPSDLDLNGEAVQDEDEDGDGAAVLQGPPETKAITNNDVLGDAIPYEQQVLMRQYCYQMLELNLSARGNAQFPGSHPVSLNRENLQLLRQRYYYATWKADGTRYMMLITHDGCYLIDRNFCFRRVQMRFPLKTATEGVHNLTLIDGEMIIDTIPGVGLKRRYLAYDLVVLNSMSVIKRPFSERWRLLEEEIIRPRNVEKKQIECDPNGASYYRYDMEPFSVRRKDFWLLSTVTKLLKEFIPSLCHDADGLIFQGWDDPYVPRTHEGLLKWKYPEMNSVDFLFEIGSEGQRLLFLFERGKKKLMDRTQVTFGGIDVDEETIPPLSGRIIECSWNSENRSWSCMRIRADKSTPNDINTYRKVMRSISDNITEEVLLNEIQEIIGLPMYADRITKAQQQHHHHRRR